MLAATLVGVSIFAAWVLRSPCDSKTVLPLPRLREGFRILETDYGNSPLALHPQHRQRYRDDSEPLRPLKND